MILILGKADELLNKDSETKYLMDLTIHLPLADPENHPALRHIADDNKIQDRSNLHHCET